MIMLSDLAVAVLIGGAGAGGILLTLAALPRWRASGLAVRIAPYVRGVVDPEALPPGVAYVPGALPARARTLRERASALLSRMLGGEATTAQRLSQAGLEPDVARFRGRQLLAVLVGIAVGAGLVVLFALTAQLSLPVFVLPVLGGVGGALLYDTQLSTRARARVQRIGEELPTTLEFLALCLSAGESFLDTLRRLAAIGSGELSREIREVVLAVHTGSSLGDALRDLAVRLDTPAVTRAVDHLSAALDRGAPLADVLHAQAGDAREDAKRILIEQAGRKEIVMMLPLVFLILPLSVLFAVFPGVFMFNVGLN